MIPREDGQGAARASEGAPDGLPAVSRPPGGALGSALRWFEGLDAEGPEFASPAALLTLEGTKALLADLRSCGAGDLANLIARLDDASSLGAGETTAARLLGWAAGTATGARPDSSAIRHAGAFLSLFPGARQPFDAAMDAALSSSADARSTLRQTLLAEALSFGTVAGRGFLHRDLALLMRQRRSAPSIESRWDEAHWYPTWIRETFAFDALRRAAPGDYLEVLEAFQDGEPVRQILEAANLDAVVLADLLRIARASFDASGVWQSDAKAATYLLGLATKRLVLEPDDGDGDDRFRVGSAAVIAALAARPDCHDLGFAWSNRMVVMGGRRGRGATPCRRSRELALLGALAEILEDHPAPLEWVRAAHDPWRRPRLVAALLPHCREGREASAAALDLVEAAAREGAFDLTAIADGGPGERSIEATVVANALAAVPDLATRVIAVWRRLMPERDRARYWRSQAIGNPPSPGLFLAHWLVHPLLLLAGRSSGARDLWSALAGIAAEGRLTERSLLHDPEGWPHVLSCLGAAWPHVFPDRPAPGQLGNLAGFLCPFAVADEPFLGIALALHGNGAGADEIAEACRGPDRLRRMLETAACDRKGRLEFAELEYDDAGLGVLIAELDGSARPPS